MILINDQNDAPPGPKVVAIGSFDGVHLGHRTLLARALALAREEGVPLLVYTFDPPTKVFTRGVPVLSTLSEKAELLAQAGAEIVLAVPFDAEFAARSKEAFLEDLRALEPLALVVGEDFRFGRGRSGGPGDLAAVARVETVPLLELGGAPVKSSRIRERIEAGDVEAARLLLGRPYAVRGVVTRGERIGTRIGFPTANVAVPRQKALPPGVFAVWVRRQGRRIGGVANVGRRPTLGGGGAPRLEVHLLEPSEELYGEELAVEFVKRLRGEQKFESLEALKAQIAADAEAARRLLYDPRRERGATHSSS